MFTLACNCWGNLIKIRMAGYARSMHGRSKCILVTNTEVQASRKTPFRSPRHRWKDGIKHKKRVQKMYPLSGTESHVAFTHDVFL